MRILLDVTHPADVHFFSRPIARWRAEGHAVDVLARDKDVALALLRRLQIAATPLGRAGRGLLGLAFELLARQARVARRMRATRPDVVAAFGGTFVAYPARRLGVRSVIFTDTENARVSNGITLPFASLVCTPRCYPGRVRAPHLRYQGYKELSYLHPRYFTPDRAALAALGLQPYERFALVRLVAWGSGHDFFDHGLVDAVSAIRRLERQARVVISAEGALPAALEALRFRGPVESLHHLLAFAALVLGESPTVATEAAVLGTPAVLISTSRRSYVDELQQRYGLISFHGDRRHGQAEALARAEELLGDPQARERHQERRARMLAEQEDVAEFVTDVVLGRRGAA